MHGLIHLLRAGPCNLYNYLLIFCISSYFLQTLYNRLHNIIDSHLEIH